MTTRRGGRRPARARAAPDSGRGSRSQPSRGSNPRDEISRRAPRVEHRPDVPEHDGDEHHPDPEDDVDERRREVRARPDRSERRSRPDDGEQEQRQRLDDATRPGREDERLEPGPEATPGPFLELWLLPERAERKEREHEHRRSADEEQPAGDGKISDPAEAVRSSGIRNRERPERDEREGASPQGFTWRSAIWSPRLSSSISKRPGIEATNAIFAGFPGATSPHQVVAVDVNLVGHVGRDDDRHLRALVDRRALEASDDLAVLDDDGIGLPRRRRGWGRWRWIRGRRRGGGRLGRTRRRARIVVTACCDSEGEQGRDREGCSGGSVSSLSPCSCDVQWGAARLARLPA